ncbi:MAG: glycosyltransferase family 39 protein [Chroococcus sp. CMT-3BRIN-NPC107]|jgi:4-amino-4-deoxy-L-arabinose transferase-like glycosyltransferase|nr:glycosyltransferase family 39 protein [Chroococcus sp. CMT-3BRIN-NPC107]
MQKTKLFPWQIWGILLVIWLAIALIDLVWLKCDRTIPDWDRADYLTGSLNYYQALQHPQWLDSQWWRSFWLLSSKIPPFTYIAAAIIQQIVGTGQDSATLVNVLFNGITIVAVYGLGVELFSVEVGLWAALLCQVFPALYQLRLDFLLDFPLTAAVTLSFWCLTVWRSRKAHNWLWAAAFGVSLGVALLVKQTTLFFLLVPIIWVGVETISRRLWGRLLQLVGALSASLLVCGWWYGVNWLFVLTSGKRATIDSAIAENDPALNTIGAWTYYWQVLPIQVSWLLLIVPIVGLLMYCRLSKKQQHSFGWLAVFWVGAYLLCSVNVNKDSRYVLPYLPVVAIFLADGLTSFRGRWQKPIRFGTVGLAVLLMVFNLFPVVGMVEVLSPYGQHYANFNTQLPHRQVVSQIIQTEPFLRSTVGVLPSTAEINQHNFNYFGALQHFQVYARQVGTRKQQIKQDGRSLDWFLTKTGIQGSISEAQTLMVNEVETSPDFQRQKSWRLPDKSLLQLYHRRLPQVKVEPIKAKLDKVEWQVILPKSSPPGVPIPVTYQWSGNWQELKSGLVLLSWHQINTNRISWINDHAIGMGNLYSQIASSNGFRVTETSAMLPPKNTPPGIYTVNATYLNQQTGESYVLPSLPVSLEINPLSAPTAAPELDLISQLQVLAATMPQGTPALEYIFAEVARINQYDPTQDYLQHAKLALQYRLKSTPQKDPHWAYALALATLLKRDVKGAIVALEQVTQLDSQNPYAYAYLAFVRLYKFQPHLAEIVLQKATSLNPNLPELYALNAIAALMQAKIFPAWNFFQQYKASSLVQVTH